MTGDPIPEQDHVVRYCSATRLNEENGNPLPGAFQLRKDEEYLSVEWLEYCNTADRSAQLKEVRSSLKEALDIRPSAKLALLNVGATISKVKENTPDNRVIDITHQPVPKRDSHSGIFNSNHTDAELLIATLIAEEVCETLPAKR